MVQPPLDTRGTREYLDPSTVALSVVHVAEREHSRMAAGSHFVNDEEERRAVATIFATLSIASRCHVITDSFFCEILHHPSGSSVPLSAALWRNRGLSPVLRIFNESGRSGGQICRVLRDSKRAWKITHTIEFSNANHSRLLSREETTFQDNNDDFLGGFPPYVLQRTNN